MKKQQAIKKVESAIDAMVDFQDEGFGNNAIAKILDQLNSLRSDIEEITPSILK